MLIIFYEPCGRGKLAHYTLKLSTELLNLSGKCIKPGEGESESMLGIIIATSKNYELFSEFSEKKNKNLNLKLMPVFSSQNPGIFEIFRFIRLIEREKPGIIHFQYPLPPLGMLLFLFFMKAREFSTMLKKLFKFKKGEQRKQVISLFYTAHNTLPHAEKIYGYFFYRIFLRNMKKIIVHAADDIKAMENLGIRKSKIAVIEHGVVFDKPKISKFHARRKLGISRSIEGEKSEAREIIFLFFGYISEKKGIRELLQAFKNACERIERSKERGKIMLVIAGKESRGFDIKKEIEALGIKNIYINRTYIDKKEAELYFKACDVLVLPYRTEKHSPLVQVAYYFGIPVIASDKQKESVLHRKTGYVFKAGDVKELEKAIIELSDERNLKMLSENALKLSKKYSWKKIAEKTINAYFTQ